jgi:cytochrome P450
MMLEEFDPFSSSVLADPYPWYRLLRETAPVHHIPGTDIWAVSRYADALTVLRNHAAFSSSGGVGPEWDPHPMLSMYDPPEHTRLRRLVAGHFTPRFVVSFADRMRATTNELLDTLLNARAADFVSDFAQPLAASLIADLLGIPMDRRAEFRRWSVGVVETLTSRHDASAASAARKTSNEFVQYIRQVIEERRSASHTDTAVPDIISLLLQAKLEEALTPREVTAFCVLLVVAGFETTVNGLANIANAMTLFPMAWQEVEHDPSLSSSMIEEALRYDSPDQAFFRNTLVDTSIGETTIPARSKVMVLFGSANRDPEKYANPDLFDVRRNPVDHLAFGAGVHYCLGASLARQQYAIVVDAFLQRVKRMDPNGSSTRHVNVIMRGFREFPVRLEGRGS